jgi:hypothetical protein
MLAPRDEPRLRALLRASLGIVLFGLGLFVVYARFVG